MNKLSRFMAKNRILSNILLCAFLCSFYTVVLVLEDVNIIGVVLLDILIILCSVVSVNTAASRLLKKPLDELNNRCDPIPLLMETQELLTYKNTKAVNQLLLVDYAVALREVGEFQKNYDILKSINIDELNSTLPAAKIVYYNNLSDACCSIGDYAQADIWYEKMMQIYSTLPENKVKKRMSASIGLATAAAWLRRGNYNLALNTLACVVPENLRHRISIAMTYAEIFIKLNDFNAARTNLEFVIANGNKLFAVKQAYDMLNFCNASQSSIYDNNNPQ